MTENTTLYPHAAPVLREELCRAVRKAHDAKTHRERGHYYGQAFGFARALEVLRLAADVGPLAPGIAHRDELPTEAVEMARTFLGADADITLDLS